MLQMGHNPLTTTGSLDIIQAISENRDSAITFLSMAVRLSNLTLSPSPLLLALSPSSLH
jgi:hypothetical protein